MTSCYEETIYENHINIYFIVIRWLLWCFICFMLILYRSFHRILIFIKIVILSNLGWHFMKSGSWVTCEKNAPLQRSTLLRFFWMHQWLKVDFVSRLITSENEFFFVCWNFLLFPGVNFQGNYSRSFILTYLLIHWILNLFILCYKSFCQK